VSGAELTANAVIDFSVDGCANVPVTNPGVDCTVSPTGGKLTVEPVTGATMATGEITLAAEDDTLSEPTETITVTVTGASTTGAIAPDTSGGNNQSTAPLEDNDALSVGIARKSEESGDIAETGGVAKFTVSLTSSTNSTPTADVLLDFTVSGDVAAGDYDIGVSGGDAPAAADTGGTLRISAPDTSGEITITASHDTLLEATENFTITLTAVRGGGGIIDIASTQNSAGAAITDDEKATVRIARSDTADADSKFTEAPATEPAADRTAEFTVTVSGAELTANAVVMFTVTGCDNGDTVLADCTLPDGVTNSLTVMPNPGSTSAQAVLTITAVDDELSEMTETIRVTLTKATSTGDIAPSTTPAEITDSAGLADDDPITASIARSGEATAISENGGAATFAVSLDHTPTAPLLLPFSISGSGENPAVGADHDITAPVPADTDTDTTGTLRIESGATMGSITITAQQDELLEGLESFAVRLGAGLSGGGGAAPSVSATAGEAVASISDDDRATVRISRTGGSGDIAENGGVATFQVTLDKTPTAEWSVDFSVTGAVVAGDYDITAPAGIEDTATGGTLTLASPAKSGRITITAVNDDLLEGREAFSVQLDSASGGGGATPAISSMAAENAAGAGITDDDSASIDIARKSGEPVNIAEKDGKATFVVTISGAVPTQNVTVPFTVNPAATEPLSAADYNITTPSGIAESAESGALTIAANSTMGEIVISATDDNLLENTETASVTLSAPSGGGGAALTRQTPSNNSFGIVSDETASATIARVDDDDPADGGFIEGGAESAGSAVFRVTVSGAALSANAEVSFAIDGSGIVAGADGDYTLATGSESPLRIPPGSGADPTTTHLDITVLARADGLNEPTETLRVTLTGASSKGSLAYQDVDADSGETTARSAEADITDNDPITATLSGSANAAEGSDSEFTVTLSGGTHTAPVSVPWSATVTGTGDGHASAGDFTGNVLPASSFDIAVGETAGTFSVPIWDDGFMEPAETFELSLGDSTGGGGGVISPAGSPLTVTIAASVDTERTVELSLAPAEVTEGATAAFKAKIDGHKPTGNIVVTWSVAAGSGANPATAADISGTPGGTLTFTPDNYETEQDFSVTTAQDMLLEAPETFHVVLAIDGTATTGAVLPAGGIIHPVRIADDDSVTVTIARDADADGFAEGGSSGAGTAVFTVTVSGAELTADASIPFDIGGSGVESGDYSATASPLTIARLAADATPADRSTLTGKISVSAVDDTLNEAAETLTITLGAAPSTTGSIVLGAARQANAALADNDPITVKIADESEDSDPDTSGVQVEEGGSAVFRVTLDGAASGSAAVVTIPYTVGGDVSDNSGCLRGIADYRDSMSGTLSIPAETASATISIAALQDQCREPDETLTVTLGSAPSVAAGGGVIARSSVAGEQRASVVIPANANTVRDFSAIVADADATDRDSEKDGVQVNEGDMVTFSVRLAGQAPDSDASVAWEISGVSSEDYEIQGTAASPLSFSTSNWETAQTISLLVHTDGLNEGAEQLTLTLSQAMGGGVGGTGITLEGTSAQAEITASDPILYTISADQSVVEGDSPVTKQQRFDIRISGAENGSQGGEITLPFAIAGASTAAAPGDYEISASPLTFAGAPETKQIVVTVKGDELSEQDETVVIVLGTASTASSGAGTIAPATAEDATATLTIEDDESLSIRMARKEGEDGDITEGGVPAKFTVRILGGEPTEALVVNFRIAGSGAAPAAPEDLSASGTGVDSTAGTDAITGTLTIAAGETSGEISVNAESDDELEAPEDFDISLESTTGGGGAAPVVEAAHNSQNLGITDAGASLSIARISTDASIDEGETATFRVTLDKQPPRDVTVYFLVSGVSTGDYELPSEAAAGELTIAGGETTVDLTLTAVDDAQNEAAETLIVVLDRADTPIGAIVVDSGGSEAQVEIAESDPITVSIAVADTTTDADSSTPGVQVPEGQTATFRITLDGAADGSAGSVTIPFTLEGTGITAGDLSIEGLGHLRVLSPGVTFTELEIPIRLDGVAEPAETLEVALGSVTADSAAGKVLLSSDDAQLKASVQIPASEAARRTFHISIVNTEDKDMISDGIQVDEGDTATFRVRLSGDAPGSDATVKWTVTPYVEDADWTGAAREGTLTFTPDNWNTPQDLVFNTVDDGLNEGLEIVEVILSEPAGGGGNTEFGDEAADLQIRSSDPVTFSFTAAEARVDESEGMATVTLMFTGAPEGIEGMMPDFPVRALIGDPDGGTAIYDASTDFEAGGDFRIGDSSPRTVTGALATDLQLIINDDLLNEADETIVLEVAAPGTLHDGNGEFIAGTNIRLTLTIADDDDLMLSISSNGEAEEGSAAVFTLLVQGTASTALRVEYTLSGSGITAADVETGSLTGHFDLTLAEAQAGEARRAISIADDDRPEEEETLILTLGAITLTGGGSAQAPAPGNRVEVTIPANDALTLNIARHDMDGFSEGEAGAAGTAVFRVSVDGGTPAESLTVPFALSGAGIERSDYQIANTGGVTPATSGERGNLVIAAGSSHGDITVRALDDDLGEAEETLRVELQTPSGGGGSIAPRLGVRRATAPIAANEAATASLSRVGTGNVNEGTAVTFRVRLDIANAAPVTLAWSAEVISQANAGGTNGPGASEFSTAGGVDNSFMTHQGASGRVRISAGSSSADFTLTPAQDGLGEGEETFRVTLGTASVGSGGGTVAEDATPVEVTVNPSVAINRWFAVEVVSGTVSDTMGDRANEGDTITFEVGLFGSDFPTAAASVDWSISGVEDSDWSSTDSQTITIPYAGMTPAPQQFSITLAADNLNEGEEELLLTLSNASGGGTGGTYVSGLNGDAQVTINASDPLTYAVAAVPETAGENDGEATFRVTLSGASLGSAGDLRVPFEVDGASTATDILDYTIITPSGAAVFAIPAGQQSGEISVSLADDTLNEPDETIVVALDTGNIEKGDGAGEITAGDATGATLTITDADTILVAIAPHPGSDNDLGTVGVQVSEGNIARFTVTLLDATATRDVEISYTVSGTGGDLTCGDYSDATAAERNFNCASGEKGTLRIPVGMQRGTIAIQIVQDRLQEDDPEVLVVTLSDAMTDGGEAEAACAYGRCIAQVQIPANGASARDFMVSVNHRNIQEGRSVTFTVTLMSHVMQSPPENATVEWEISGVEETDYRTGSGSTLTFRPSSWNRPQRIRVEILDDDLNEAAETLLLSLVNPAGGGTGGTGVSISMGSAQTVIAASDPITYSIETEDRSVAEGESGGGEDVVFRVTLSGVSEGDLELPLEQGSGSTTNSDGVDDYAFGENPLIIAAGEMEGEITVSVTGDDRHEADERLILQLAAARPDADGGEFNPGRNSTVLTITDDDPIVVSLQGPENVAESAPDDQGRSSESFTVRLTGGAHTTPVMVPWLHEDISTTFLADSRYRSDYRVAEGEMPLSFPVGTAELQIEIHIVDDALEEGEEQFRLVLGTPRSVPGADISTDGSTPHLVTIAPSEEGAREVGVEVVGEAMEGGSAVFRVRITGNAHQDAVTVNYALTGNAILGEDYTGDAATGGGATGMVSIPPGEFSADIELPILEDDLSEMGEEIILTLSGQSGGESNGVTNLAEASQATAAIADSGLLIAALVREGRTDSLPVEDAVRVAEGDSTIFTVQLSSADGVPQRTVGDLVLGFLVVGFDFPVPEGEEHLSPMSDAGQTDYRVVTNEFVETPGRDGQTFGTLRIPAGESSAQVEVRMLDDEAWERPELLGIELREVADSGGNFVEIAEFSRNHAMALIIDTDTLSASVSTVVPPDNAERRCRDYCEGQDAVFRVQLTGGTPGQTTEAYASMDYEISGSATGFVEEGEAGALDYTEPEDVQAQGGARRGVLVIPPGETSGEIRIPIINDDTPEPAETIIITLLATPTPGGGAVNVLPPASATAVIGESDNTPVTLVASGPEELLLEGEEALFTIAISQADIDANRLPSTDVRVFWRIDCDPQNPNPDRDTDPECADFGQVRGEVLLTRSEVSVEVTISIVEDNFPEPAERFTLHLASFQTAFGDVTLADNRPPASGESSHANAMIATSEDPQQITRRSERTQATTTVLDRSFAEVANIAINTRFTQGAAGARTGLRIAGRELIAAPSAEEATESLVEEATAPKHNAASAELGLALFGAAGLGAAGFGGTHDRDALDPFGGLSAGIAGDRNMSEPFDFPSTQQFLNGSGFNMNAEGWNGKGGITLWGSGAAVTMQGKPKLDGGVLDYTGANQAMVIGAERWIGGNLLTGMAVSYNLSAVDFEDASDASSASSGRIVRNMILLHPYASWWPNLRTNMWLVQGYGSGAMTITETYEVEGNEREREAETSASLMLVSFGLKRLYQLRDRNDIALTFETTRVESEFAETRFDDGVLLRSSDSESNFVSTGIEGSHYLNLSGGRSMRLYASGKANARVRGTLGAEEAFSYELGFGTEFASQRLGVRLWLDGGAKQSAGNSAQRFSISGTYDRGNDQRGLALSINTAMTGLRKAAEEVQALKISGARARENTVSSETWDPGQTLTGELSYGVALPRFGNEALLSPYGRFDLGLEKRNFSAGLRLEAGSGFELRLEGVLQQPLRDENALPEFDLMLHGDLRF